jgi:hypothetical protein
MEEMMILQNPIQVATSTIQNTYGAILSTANKVADTKPTSAVSDYAVPPSASSPVLSAFFQTLSQIDQSNQNPALPPAPNTIAQATAPQAAASLNTTALQEFTYSLFQNLQGSTPPAPGVPVPPGLGPLPTLTPGPNTSYLNNLPDRLNTLSASLRSANPTGGANTLEGLKSAYQSLLNSIGANGVNASSASSGSLASFLDQMSQNLQAQNVTSISPKGSLLDTKA